MCLANSFYLDDTIKKPHSSSGPYFRNFREKTTDIQINEVLENPANKELLSQGLYKTKTLLWLSSHNKMLLPN